MAETPLPRVVTPAEFLSRNSHLVPKTVTDAQLLEAIGKALMEHEGASYSNGVLKVCISFDNIMGAKSEEAQIERVMSHYIHEGWKAVRLPWGDYVLSVPVE